MCGLISLPVFPRLATPSGCRSVRTQSSRSGFRASQGAIMRRVPRMSSVVEAMIDVDEYRHPFLAVVTEKSVVELSSDDLSLRLNASQERAGRARRLPPSACQRILLSRALRLLLGHPSAGSWHIFAQNRSFNMLRQKNNNNVSIDEAPSESSRITKRQNCTRFDFNRGLRQRSGGRVAYTPLVDMPLCGHHFLMWSQRITFCQI